MKIRLTVALTMTICACFASSAEAYIGPGAGFAVVSSFFILFFTGVVAFLTILIWPFRTFLLFLKRRKLAGRRRVGRVVVVGLDGLDPDLAEQFMADGLLPEFQKLADQGAFRRLRTTHPAISPVAWSTFATGVNPGKHRIFDFYTRDPKNYSPVLSSVRVSTNKTFKKIGPIKIPYTKTTSEFLRKSVSFWKPLGTRGIFSSVLRVPISFPPEKFYGACLSAMCTPDLRGTQGAFTLFTAEKEHGKGDEALEGQIIPIEMKEGRFSAEIPGPALEIKGSKTPLTTPMEGEVDETAGELVINVGEERLRLKPGVYSPWVTLEFKSGRRKKVSGIVRFLASHISDEPRIYMTPINIDPEKPSLPVSHPYSYCVSLAKLNGPFSTLGLSEDTWALNERIIDEEAFLNQAYDIFEERKCHLFDALKKNKDGFVTMVFDATDRVQHMFFRYLDEDHPANRDKDTEKFKDAIQVLYRKMDDLLGETRKALREDDLLMVISDHGFKSFKWGVNLNTWLWREGYLTLKDDASPGSLWFADVDWAGTRAYAYGLAGIFLNIKGRERDGRVRRGKERVVLQKAIREKLTALVDEENGRSPVRNVYLSQEVLKGPYVNDAPDLMVGYDADYRVSWNSAVGKISEKIIEENTKSWSGDHSIDPELAPGVFFSNWKMEEPNPTLADMAPTILRLYGVEKQKYHDGRVLSLTPPAPDREAELNAGGEEFDASER